MRSPARHLILVAAHALLFLVVVLPPLVSSGQSNWVEQIAQRVQSEEDLMNRGPERRESERYLARVFAVQQALRQGDVPLVQAEMSRLVRMVATKEGGLSDSSAQLLLLYISDVTPTEYLDETTQSRLHLIRSLMAFRADTAEEIPSEASQGLTVTPYSASPKWWSFEWARMGTVHPTITLGVGMLILVTIGALVLFIVGIGGRWSRAGLHAKRPNG